MKLRWSAGAEWRQACARACGRRAASPTRCDIIAATIVMSQINMPGTSMVPLSP
jgi:hypothetical protein